MIVNGKPYRSLWIDSKSQRLTIINQTLLPHHFETLYLDTVEQVCHAIKAMQVRGAPLIGATAAYGLALGLRENPTPENEQKVAEQLLATRPTAINLHWAIERIRASVQQLPLSGRANEAMHQAAILCDEDVSTCSAIGDYGLSLIKKLRSSERQTPFNILTHCNAGWLATVDWGTALAPIYKAHNAGLPVHVWVDETRPRNQGAHLTAWELSQHGVPHTVISDNTGGHLMQHGLVDLCLVGSDRTTAAGDVCNKIGTYLKALAAHDNQVPFYVALPVSTIDWRIKDGLKEIPIEQRESREVSHIYGKTDTGQHESVRIIPEQSEVANYAFDVTPARLISGLITEKGIVKASENAMQILKATSD